MIKDITIGQYFPGRSPVHRMDPRAKLVLTIVFIVLLFVVGNPFGFVVSGRCSPAATWRPRFR